MTPSMATQLCSKRRFVLFVTFLEFVNTLRFIRKHCINTTGVSVQENMLLQELLQWDQGHLFATWPPPGAAAVHPTFTIALSSRSC